METTDHLQDASHPREPANGQDLERRLEIAEQRYAAARGVGDKARSELRELASRRNVSPQLLKSARARLEAITARCRRLRDLIDNLEEQLDL